MGRLKNLVLKSADFIDRIEDYFRNSKREITARNLDSLKYASVGGLILLMLLLCIAPYIVKGWTITGEYWGMFPTLVGFTVFSFLYDKYGKRNYYVVQIACILFYVMLLFHFIMISVFPYPDGPESYISVFFIMMPIVFIIKPWIMEIIIVVGALVFCSLVLQVKTLENVVSHDLFASVMSAAFAQVAMLMVYRLRIDDFTVRESYKKQSRMDLPSGLLNKKSYENLCELSLRERADDAPCAFFVFDVDEFKGINDTYGHIVGDRVIEIIGGVLNSVFRAEDIVGRIGGDEFSAYMLHNGNEKILQSKCEKILSLVSERTQKVLKFNVTLSIGVAVNFSGQVDYKDLYITADKALYNAKLSQFDKYVIQDI